MAPGGLPWEIPGTLGKQVSGSGGRFLAPVAPLPSARGSPNWAEFGTQNSECRSETLWSYTKSSLDIGNMNSFSCPYPALVLVGSACLSYGMR
ncbi:unnamed protein product, partial [Iphiclides podalirius]